MFAVPAGFQAFCLIVESIVIYPFDDFLNFVKKITEENLYEWSDINISFKLTRSFC